MEEEVMEMEKTAKKFSIHILILTGTLLVAAALFVVLVDPFYHYHKAWFGMEPYLDEAVYQSTGAAEHFDYDSVILGSSMSENFSVDKFNELFGWNTIKLSYSAAKMGDYNAILQKIFEHGGVKNVVFGIDYYAMVSQSDGVFMEHPEYLYNNNILDDVFYVFNKDVLLRGVNNVKNKLLDAEPSYTSSYFWNRDDFSTRTVMKNYVEIYYSATKTQIVEDQYKESGLQNMRVLGNYIASHPETTFYIYFPPYNMMLWAYYIKTDTKDQIMEMQQAIIEYLLEFDNVKLYYFMNAKEIVTDLDNYIDQGHHTPEINDFIMESMAENKYRIYDFNYQYLPGQIDTLIKSYDFDIIRQYADMFQEEKEAK